MNPCGSKADFMTENPKLAIYRFAFQNASKLGVVITSARQAHRR